MQARRAGLVSAVPAVLSVARLLDEHWVLVGLKGTTKVTYIFMGGEETCRSEGGRKI